MIAKSDLIILLVSTTALVVGVFRWQANIDLPQGTAATVAHSGSMASGSTEAVSLPAGERDTGNQGSEAASGTLTRVAADPTTGIAGTLTRPAADAGDRAATDGTQASATTAPQTVAGDATEVAGTLTEPLYGVYTVQSGDYLSKIARQFGTSVDTLMAINSLENDTIMIDQPLRYPLPAN